VGMIADDFNAWCQCETDFTYQEWREAQRTQQALMSVAASWPSVYYDTPRRGEVQLLGPTLDLAHLLQSH
jgi:hypothetical protein